MIERGRVIGIDYGEKRIGVAVTDPLWITAQPVDIVANTGSEKAVEQLREIVTEYEADTVVVGLPKNMNNTEGDKALEVRAFADLLADRIGVKIVFQDERLSSAMVQRGLKFAGVKAKKRKNPIDASAAQLILQNYIQKVQQSEE